VAARCGGTGRLKFYAAGHCRLKPRPGGFKDPGSTPRWDIGIFASFGSGLGKPWSSLCSFVRGAGGTLLPSEASPPQTWRPPSGAPVQTLWPIPCCLSSDWMAVLTVPGAKLKANTFPASALRPGLQGWQVCSDVGHEEDSNCFGLGT